MEVINAKIKIRTDKGSTLEYNITSFSELQQAYETIRDLNRRELATFETNTNAFEFNRCNK